MLTSVQGIVVFVLMVYVRIIWVDTSAVVLMDMNQIHNIHHAQVLYSSCLYYPLANEVVNKGNAKRGVSPHLKI
jgi:hypothetical protein